MRTFLILMGTLIFVLLKEVAHVQAATLKCSENNPIVSLEDRKGDVSNSTEEFDVINDSKEGNKNSIKKIFQNIQCTLERAKPWVVELQQEAKRLEEAAKLLGLGIINSFGEFVDKLVEESAGANMNKQNFTANSAENEVNSTEIVNKEKISEYLCPEGFIADHNGICERNY